MNANTLNLAGQLLAGLLAINAVVLTNAREGGSVALTPKGILGLTAISRQISRGPGPLQNHPREPLRGAASDDLSSGETKTNGRPEFVALWGSQSPKNKGL